MRQSRGAADPQRPASGARPVIGVASVIGRGWPGRRTPKAPTGALENLVERVLRHDDPLPFEDAALQQLIAGLRQHLQHLEHAARQHNLSLARDARHVRRARPPEEPMALLIHTIRLAEVAQALLDLVTAGPTPRTH